MDPARGGHILKAACGLSTKGDTDQQAEDFDALAVLQCVTSKNVRLH